ncbi:uncharacterized protein [Euwallacea similis]|uniref:uncharacterized protein n=1 Tax=Euwallacea similis TaxID=1736056 RepID=UPI00344BE4D8
MSSGTVAVEEFPSADEIDKKSANPKLTESQPPILLIASLWLFNAIFCACKVQFTRNLQGVFISFNIQDVMLTMFAAWMMHKGLATRHIELIYPWVIVILYGLYFNHYNSLRRMMTVLKASRYSTGLPWTALFLMSIALGLKVILVMRTLQLSTNLWYRRRWRRAFTKFSFEEKF